MNLKFHNKLEIYVGDKSVGLICPNLIIYCVKLKAVIPEVIPVFTLWLVVSKSFSIKSLNVAPANVTVEVILPNMFVIKFPIGCLSNLYKPLKIYKLKAVIPSCPG